MLNIWTTIRRSTALFLGAAWLLGQASPLVVPRLPSSFVGTREVAAKIEISGYELNHEIQARLFRVPEFKVLLQESKHMGVKIYLFGGTAAAFGHYVRWDLMREKGDARYQANRFDYDFTNIYRSTQDLDIVVDGDASKISELQSLLSQKFPYLQGDKDAWEVRSLRQDYNGKMALLNNPDFLNQNTDSNSTGMIEITDKLGLVVHDLRDWNNPESQFLTDVAEGKVHYYTSDLHHTTEKAKQGHNPLIFSAIRLLVKAVQFELEMRPEDIAKVQKIINDFDPKSAPAGSYVNKWIEKNSKKLVQNAVNIEYALRLVNELGLKEKLIAMNHNATEVDSLAWWMSKEPLPTLIVGEGKGRTARDLGIDIVAHETNQYLAYESITKAHTGDPNVLISRKYHEGEAAVYGNGFYTRMGREGAHNTGWTIRFKVDPNAREGSDFFKAADDFVVFKNKAALKVIPESLNVTVLQYFQLLQKGNFKSSDRGILEQMKRRVSKKVYNVDQEEMRQINALIQEEFNRAKSQDFPTVLLREWLDSKMLAQDKKLKMDIILYFLGKASTASHAPQLVRAIESYQDLPNAEEVLVNTIMNYRKGDRQAFYLGDDLAKEIYAKPGFQGNAKILDAFLKRGYISAVASGIGEINETPSDPALISILYRFVDIVRGELSRDTRSDGYKDYRFVVADLARVLSLKPAMEKYLDVLNSYLERAIVGLRFNEHDQQDKGLDFKFLGEVHSQRSLDLLLKHLDTEVRREEIQYVALQFLVAALKEQVTQKDLPKINSLKTILVGPAKKPGFWKVFMASPMKPKNEMILKHIIRNWDEMAAIAATRESSVTCEAILK